MGRQFPFAYPAPISVEFDDQLLELAERHGGRWSGSGCGIVERIPDRDIEFHFPDEVAAQRFIEACRLLAVVKVLLIREE